MQYKIELTVAWDDEPTETETMEWIIDAQSDEDAIIGICQEIEENNKHRDANTAPYHLRSLTVVLRGDIAPTGEVSLL